MPQDAVSAAVAALEYLRHHIFAEGFILDVHDGIVQIGVEAHLQLMTMESTMH